MKIKIQLQIINDDNHLDLTEEIAVFEKSHQQLAEVGLTLSESKTLLKQLQQHIVEQQAATFVSEHRGCEQCERQRRIKGYTSITFRTVFGNVQLRSPQLHQCPCHPQHSGQLVYDWIDSLGQLAKEVEDDARSNPSINFESFKKRAKPANVA